MGSAPAAISFSKMVDVLYTVLASVAIPAIAYVAQYRVADRVRFDIAIVPVRAGEYDLCGRKRSGGLLASGAKVVEPKATPSGAGMQD